MGSAAAPLPPGRSSGRRRFLLIPGSYRLDNVGDIVMCKVAVDRVRAADPNADVRVVSVSEELLDHHGMGHATAVDEGPWLVWSRPVVAWLHRAGHPRVRAVPFTWPKPFITLARAARQVSGLGQAKQFIDEVLGADCIVLCGQGALHDGSSRRAARIASLVRLAGAGGVPIVAASQGIGPLDDAGLRRIVAEALREVDRLGLRDADGSVAALSSLGLAPSSWTVTGDDAIEWVLGHGTPAPEDRIGISLRDNKAAGVPGDVAEVVSRAVEAVHPGIAVEAVSMMEQPRAVSDAAVLAEVRPAGSTVTAHDAEPAASLAALARCRLVITGTYHAAVFAQSLGVPAICLASTPYYGLKMRGVLDQFGGTGGTVLDPSSPSFEADLADALATWWEPDPAVASTLRASAAAQADASREFFLTSIAAAVPPS